MRRPQARVDGNRAGAVCSTGVQTMAWVVIYRKRRKDLGRSNLVVWECWGPRLLL